jgi:histidine triad (HIT) family protein
MSSPSKTLAILRQPTIYILIKIDIPDQCRIEAGMSDTCIFCKIASKEIPSDSVYEDGDFLAFRDINPTAPTHILIIPRKHIATINDLEAADAQLAGRMIVLARDLAAREGLSEKGYRLVFNCQEGAGQSVWHIHLHLLGGRAMQWPPG